MKKRFLPAALVLAFVMIFCSCGKSSSDENVATYDPMLTTTGSASADTNWWQQYTTQPAGTTKAASSSSGSKTTAKSSGTKTTAKAAGTKTTAKSSGSKSSGSGTATAATEYKKESSNTMTFTNTNGGTTTLTKDPSNAYIKADISKLGSEMNETYTAANMMCYSDSANSDYHYVFVYSATSGKSASNLVYVVVFTGGASDIAAVYVSSDGNKTALYFFPYAQSGNTNYTQYREVYIKALNTAANNEDQYTTVRDNYTALHSDNNVKTFLSW